MRYPSLLTHLRIDLLASHLCQVRLLNWRGTLAERPCIKVDR